MAGKITLKSVRSLTEGQEVWDSELKGFGARRQRSETVAYILMYRTRDGRQRRLTIGRHGQPWTPDTARDEAKRLIGVVVAGGDPAEERQQEKKASNVAELCDLYLKDARAGRLLTSRRAAKKPSTLVTDESRISTHIKPLLGRLAVQAVTRDDVEKFMHDVAEGKTAKREKSGKARGLSNVRGGRGAASRTIGLLGGVFEYAVRKRLRPDNPVRGVLRFADGRRERRLSDVEYGQFGIGLQAAVDVWPPAAAAIRFILLSGCRSGEAIGLKWSEVDLERRTAILTDSKTGRSMRPLSKAVCDLLTTLPRSGALVFPPARGTAGMSGLPSYFKKVAALGALPSDITPHVLRHSFASVAADLGYSESTIGALIGHKGSTITSRYIHTADPVLLAAADAVAGRIDDLLALRISADG